MATTALNTILDADWDATVVTKPDIITITTDNLRAYTRVVGTVKEDIDDEMIGVGLNRQFYSEDSMETYTVHVVSSSQSDAELMIKAIEKICARYTPTSTENILQWTPAALVRNFNNIWVHFTLSITIIKAGKAGY